MSTRPRTPAKDRGCRTPRRERPTQQNHANPDELQDACHFPELPRQGSLASLPRGRKDRRSCSAWEDYGEERAASRSVSRSGRTWTLSNDASEEVPRQMSSGRARAATAEAEGATGMEPRPPAFAFDAATFDTASVPTEPRPRTCSFDVAAVPTRPKAAATEGATGMEPRRSRACSFDAATVPTGPKAADPGNGESGSRPTTPRPSILKKSQSFSHRRTNTGDAEHEALAKLQEEMQQKMKEMMSLMSKSQASNVHTQTAMQLQKLLDSAATELGQEKDKEEAATATEDVPKEVAMRPRRQSNPRPPVIQPPAGGSGWEFPLTKEDKKARVVMISEAEIDSLTEENSSLTEEVGELSEEVMRLSKDPRD